MKISLNLVVLAFPIVFDGCEHVSMEQHGALQVTAMFLSLGIPLIKTLSRTDSIH